MTRHGAFYRSALLPLQSRRSLRLPSMMRMQVNSDRLVGRVEEYFDWRAVEPLFEQ